MVSNLFYTVSGIIYDAYNKAMSNVSVQAFDKDLRHEELLGQALTDSKGKYSITYDFGKFADSEYKTADIFIRILTADGSISGQSPVYFNVTEVFTIDFKIGNTPIQEINEFDRLVEIIKTLTEPQKVAIAELRENDPDDITFLASETGENRTQIALLPIAFTFSDKTRIPPDIFYGLFRMQFPTDLNAILLIKSESIIRGITAAVNENIISSKWGVRDQIDKLVKILNQLASGVILSGSDNQSSAFKQVIGAVLTKPEQQQTFVNVFLASEETSEKFWDSLSQQEGFNNPEIISDIQSTFQLNLLTNNVPALTSLLFNEQKNNPTIKDLRGFASYSFNDWKTRVDNLVSSGAIVNFPEGTEGNSPQEKAINYAMGISNLITSLYPTSVFAGRLSKDTSDAFKETRSDLITFFEKNSDFELKSNNLNKLFDSSNLDGISDKQRLKKELETINRLYKITDNYDHVSQLRSDGINSATSLIKKYTASQFKEKYGSSIGSEMAGTIFRKALQTDNLSTVLAMSIKMRNDVPVYAINGPDNDAPPDYESLFGDTNCDCEQCQSVYSPSAYLVDILNMINQYNNYAFNELIRRRPDLIQILLTCKNTNTPLPYIDLVNELLENTIAPVPPVIINGAPTYPNFQTTNSAEELVAYPEHVNYPAYNLLKSETSAYNLPLDLPLEETRLYLNKLGIDRYKLMELFYGKHLVSKYSDLNIAIEYLQLSPVELNVVNGTTPMPVSLDKVSDFLVHTSLSYIEMLQLMECYFINPFLNGERSIKIVSTSNDQATCKIEDLKFQTSDPVSLKIVPFIRLWKKTSLNIFDLDKVFIALGIVDFAGDINKNLIIPLSHIARLKSRYHTSVQSIVSIWANIDTHTYVDHSQSGQPAIPSQFENLFYNKQVTNPLDKDFSDPGNLSGTLASKTGIISAVLNLSQGDFETLNNTMVNGQLNLDNLSTFFRYSFLSHLLKISIEDLIAAIDLTGINPFGNSSQTQNVLIFIDKIASIRSSGFTIQTLGNLLTDNSILSQQIDIVSISKNLETLRQGLQNIELLDPAGDTPQEKEQNKFQNQNSLITSTLSTAFKTESGVISVLINNLVKSTADNTQPAITVFLEPAFISSTGPLFSIDTSNAVNWLYPDLFDTYVVLLKTWNRILKLISKMKITNDEFIYLQEQRIPLNIEKIWDLPNSVSGSMLFPAFENLSSIIQFRNTLQSLTPDWFHLFDFAILNDGEAKKNFLQTLSNLSNVSGSTLEFLLGPASNATDTGYLKYDFPSDYLNGAVLSNVIDCATTASKVKSSANNLSELASVIPDEETSALASSMLKSKYDVPTWLSKIKPLSNQLRVKKRDALVSYILTSPDPNMVQFRQENKIENTNSLFAYFLIDTEMDACMLTSRIKQAISSMQLFVDRCLLNLEAGITLNNDFSNQWETWRKRYRIWEANRKILLYPENWIEPDLRDDKSLFFRELESKLKQNDVTNENTEDALREYLEKLDAVANLEVIGVFPDNLSGIVHVFGRTRNVPQLYYYTKQKQSVWSAWEKIDLDIQGDHILPVVWNNRLMLFWALFTEKQEEASNGFNVPPANGYIPPAPKFLDMKLVWSEYTNGKWSSKKTSKEVLRINEVQVRDHRTNPETIYYMGGDTSLYSLSSFINGDELFIRLFIPLSYHYRQIQNNRLGAFYFDGCHSSPIVKLPDPNVEGLRVVNIYTPTGALDNNMFVDEQKNDPLTVFDTGVYKMSSGNGAVSKIVLFNNTPGTFRILPEHHEVEKPKTSTFFYSSERNNFYVRSLGGYFRPPLDDISVLTQGVLVKRKVAEPFPIVNLTAMDSAVPMSENTFDSIARVNRDVRVIPASATSNLSSVFFGKHYLFQTFYHPYVCELIKTLNNSGIEGMYKNLILDTDQVLKDGIQNKKATEIFISHGAYDPSPAVQSPYPLELVDFSYSGMYSIYNWELFFHIPLLIATRLMQNQKFEEARKWFHYIFDPTKSPATDDTLPAERFWITKPFKEEIRKGILPIQDLISNNSPDLDLQLKNWEQNPFNPHAVARLRISAYMRSTIMKYIDNLIAWGDLLFTQNTLESINEATLLYILAANMLGKKPEPIPSRAIPKESSFSSIQEKLDTFSNAKVAIQSFFSLSDFNEDSNSDNSTPMSMFCIPKNDMLLGYWDTIADRLFKIRHCLNIQGVFQQLPLFEPPINPALLVRAAAAGLDLNSIINDMNSSLPNYRFQVLLQKANEFCNDVKSLGNELLSALEKKDAEHLSLLRSGQELNLLSAMRDVKVSQVNEANEALDSLNKAKDVIQAKRDYYGSRTKKNSKEQEQLDLLSKALRNQQLEIANDILASILVGIPQTTVGLWSWGATFGGQQLADVSRFIGSSLGKLANFQSASGSIAGLEGNYQRREDDWKFQTQTAELELAQLDKQILASQIRLDITNKDLENHDLQIQQSQEMNDFLTSKFTNEELYSYMVEQVSSLYFQSYQLACNIARKAEKCFQYELGVENSSFINFGYWDSLRKGLLSGEKLQYDLRRLDNAYLEQNSREYEISKNISISLLDPLALIKLRSTGSCDFEIPEALYDMDHAGHYFRRIKSLSISMPCILGPYTSVSANLSLVTSKYRKNTDTDNTAGTGYAEDFGNDERFVYNLGVLQSIAVSNAQNDSGIFELNFRDERYLPFEGHGAISSWHLELPTEVPQFDYDTISDVIIHVKYTSKEGGSALKEATNSSLRNQLALIKQQLGETGLHLALNLKHDFSSEWLMLKKNGSVQLTIDKMRLPYVAQTLALEIENVMFIAKLKNQPTDFLININGSSITLNPINDFQLYNGFSNVIEPGISFQLSVEQTDLTILEEIILLIKYRFV